MLLLSYIPSNLLFFLNKHPSSLLRTFSTTGSSLDNIPALLSALSQTSQWLGQRGQQRRNNPGISGGGHGNRERKKCQSLHSLCRLAKLLWGSPCLGLGEDLFADEFREITAFPSFPFSVEFLHSVLGWILAHQTKQFRQSSLCLCLCAPLGPRGCRYRLSVYHLWLTPEESNCTEGCLVSFAFSRALLQELKP